MSRKTVNLNLKVRPEFKEKLDTASDILDVPYAQIVREATEERLTKLAKKNSKLRVALASLESAAVTV